MSLSPLRSAISPPPDNLDDLIPSELDTGYNHINCQQLQGPAQSPSPMKCMKNLDLGNHITVDPPIAQCPKPSPASNNIVSPIYIDPMFFGKYGITPYLSSYNNISTTGTSSSTQTGGQSQSQPSNSSKTGSSQYQNINTSTINGPGGTMVQTQTTESKSSDGYETSSSSSSSKHSALSSQVGRIFFDKKPPTGSSNTAANTTQHHITGVTATQTRPLTFNNTVVGPKIGTTAGTNLLTMSPRLTLNNMPQMNLGNFCPSPRVPMTTTAIGSASPSFPGLASMSPSFPPFGFNLMGGRNSIVPNMNSGTVTVTNKSSSAMSSNNASQQINNNQIGQQQGQPQQQTQQQQAQYRVSSSASASADSETLNSNTNATLDDFGTVTGAVNYEYNQNINRSHVIVNNNHNINVGNGANHNGPISNVQTNNRWVQPRDNGINGAGPNIINNNMNNSHTSNSHSIGLPINHNNNICQTPPTKQHQQYQQQQISQSQQLQLITNANGAYDYPLPASPTPEPTPEPMADLDAPVPPRMDDQYQIYNVQNNINHNKFNLNTGNSNNNFSHLQREKLYADRRQNRLLQQQKEREAREEEEFKKLCSFKPKISYGSRNGRWKGVKSKVNSSGTSSSALNSARGTGPTENNAESQIQNTPNKIQDLNSHNSTATNQTMINSNANAKTNTMSSAQLSSARRLSTQSSRKTRAAVTNTTNAATAAASASGYARHSLHATPVTGGKNTSSNRTPSRSGSLTRPHTTGLSARGASSSHNLYETPDSKSNKSKHNSNMKKNVVVAGRSNDHTVDFKSSWIAPIAMSAAAASGSESRLRPPTNSSKNTSATVSSLLDRAGALVKDRKDRLGNNNSSVQLQQYETQNQSQNQNLISQNLNQNQVQDNQNQRQNVIHEIDQQHKNEATTHVNEPATGTTNYDEKLSISKISESQSSSSSSNSIVQLEVGAPGTVTDMENSISQSQSIELRAQSTLISVREAPSPEQETAANLSVTLGPGPPQQTQNQTQSEDTDSDQNDNLPSDPAAVDLLIRNLSQKLEEEAAERLRELEDLRKVREMEIRKLKEVLLKKQQGSGNNNLSGTSSRGPGGPGSNTNSKSGSVQEESNMNIDTVSNLNHLSLTAQHELMQQQEVQNQNQQRQYFHQMQFGHHHHDQHQNLIQSDDLNNINNTVTIIEGAHCASQQTSKDTSKTGSKTTTSSVADGGTGTMVTDDINNANLSNFNANTVTSKTTVVLTASDQDTNPAAHEDGSEDNSGQSQDHHGWSGMVNKYEKLWME